MKLQQNLLLIIVILMGSTAIAQAQIDSVGYLSNINASIVKITNDKFGIVPDDNSGGRYLDNSLSPRFKQDGAKVVVSGIIGRIPPNVRMMGTPFKITSIDFAAGNGGGLKTTTPNKADKTVKGKPMDDKKMDKIRTSSIDNVKWDKELTHIVGTVKKLSDNLFIVNTEDGQRYNGRNLPKNYRQDDLKIIFSGMTGPPPPNVRMAGNPLKINTIGIEKIANQTGTIRKTASAFMIESGDKRYLPKNLKSEFKKEGLKVTFSGLLGLIPPNMKLAGLPFQLDSITKATNKPNKAVKNMETKSVETKVKPKTKPVRKWWQFWKN